MKKVLFTIGIIAILVGVAFAGMAASSQNNGVPGYISALDEKVSSIQRTVAVVNNNVATLTQGNMTSMETISGIAEFTPGATQDVNTTELSYDSVRHFHMSCAFNLAEPADLRVIGYIPDQFGNWVVVHHFLSENRTYFTDEFDASRVTMSIENNYAITNPITLKYAVTMTYPYQP